MWKPDFFKKKQPAVPMDKATERRRAEHVRRLVATELAALGFERTKPTYFTRLGAAPVVGFLHLHKFTYCPGFRANAGARVLNDPFEAVALNGPESSPDNLFPDFTDSDESVARTASSIVRWFKGPPLKWIDAATGADAHKSIKSPLSATEKRSLLDAIEGRGDPKRIAFSQSRLGIGND